MNFETIGTLADIKNLIKESSSDDGEGLNFELKGSEGEINFTKTHKRILSQEICAFANTYGGILCFHFGKKTTIERFPDEVTSSKFNSIEGWLRDSLEPKLLGIDIKIVDGVYLINIPESRNKPHRTSITAEYYYRHSTISQKMPEIMISSMYRSQDYLTFTATVSVSRMNSQLHMHVFIHNHSNLAGTKPKVQLQISCKIGKKIEFPKGYYFEEYPKDSFNGGPLIQIPLNAMVETNSGFSDKILYPQDTITLSNYSKPDPKIREIRYVLVRMDCMFKESIRQTEYKLIDLDSNNAGVLMSSQSAENTAILARFQRLLEQE